MAPWIQRLNRSSYLIDVLTVDEGVSQIGRVFEYGATPSGDMLKRMAPWIQRSNRSSYLIDVLTVDEGVSRWRFKNREIGHVVHYSSTSRPHTSKQRTALKSARQIGVCTISKDVLTVDEGVSGWMFKNCEIWNGFNYCVRMDRDMDKLMAPFDSGHQICLETIFNGIL